MAENKGLVIAVGLLSFLVLGCGISFSALVVYLQHEITALQHQSISETHFNRSYWGFGFAFMLSGVIGLVTCYGRNRGCYTAHMIVGIIVLIVSFLMLIGAFMSIQILSILKVDDTCHDGFKSCTCEDSREFRVSCGTVSTLYSMLIGVCAVIILGWFLVLFNTIFAGILRSRYEVPPSVIIQPPTATVVNMRSVHSMAPPAYSPPTYDRAGLVGNMEYQPGVYSK